MKETGHLARHSKENKGHGRRGQSAHDRLFAEPKKRKQRFVVIRYPVSEGVLDALAHRYGQKRATGSDLRAWAEGTLQATMEQIVSEKNDYDERKSEEQS